MALVAVALAAATLETAVVTEPGGAFGVGPDTDGAFGTDSSEQSGTEGEQYGGRLRIGGICYPALTDPRLLLAALALYLVVAYATYRSTDSFLPAIAILVSLGMPAYLLYAILTSCVPASETQLGIFPFGGNGSSIFPEGGGGGSGLTGGQAVSTPTAVFGVLLVVAVAGAILMLLVTTGDDRPDAEREPGDPGEYSPDLAAMGRTAGAAADRIEGAADVDNEVYRAWDEMTRHLDVPNPDASTPAEFATAAVEAGMSRDDVDELTRLFEAVRYGDAPPTPAREARAVEALRRIESTYAPGAGSDDAGAGGGDIVDGGGDG